MKIFICGHGEHGKNEFTDMLGARIGAGSLLCCELFVYDAMKEEHGYKNFYECYDDRRNHRAEIHELIEEYNKDDPARLSREIFKRHDVYVGCRSAKQMKAYMEENKDCYSLWICRINHLPPESSDSNKMRAEDCDFTIDNNGTIEELRAKAEKVKLLFGL